VVGQQNADIVDIILQLRDVVMANFFALVSVCCSAVD